jgi:hypothetical protein
VYFDEVDKLTKKVIGQTSSDLNIGPVWIQGLELVWASLCQTSLKLAKQEG